MWGVYTRRDHVRGQAGASQRITERAGVGRRAGERGDGQAKIGRIYFAKVGKIAEGSSHCSAFFTSFFQRFVHEKAEPYHAGMNVTRANNKPCRPPARRPPAGANPTCNVANGVLNPVHGENPSPKIAKSSTVS
jgi:hypothetical protein